MIDSDLHVEGMDEILHEGLTGTDEDVFLINPTRKAMRDLVYVIQEIERPPSVKLFADERPLKDLTDDFLVASNMADLVSDEILTIRTLPDVPRSSFLLTEDVLVSLVEGNGHVAGLTSVDESFVTGTFDHYTEQWEMADEFTLRTPPLSHIRETLEDDIGVDAVEDFDRILDILDRARGNGEGLDEVTISLLVAANNGELLYDISRWGENIRLASKATFSRSKNRLEDESLIETEKVPIDVGRPRLRLRLADRELRDADIEDVAERAEKTLG